MMNKSLTFQWAAYELARRLYIETWQQGRCRFYSGVIVEDTEQPPAVWHTVSIGAGLIDPAESFGLPALRFRLSQPILETLDVDTFYAEHCEPLAHALGYGLDA